MFLYCIIVCVCLGASIIGAICGIGGGVIVKPVLDSMGIMSVETVSFLSGLMVMSMSVYSIVKTVLAREVRFDARTGILLSAGAVAGGMIGKQAFALIQNASANPDRIGAYQAAILFILTLGTLLYTLKKASIRTRQFTNPLACILIGIILGLLSSFLGIGGGPLQSGFPVLLFLHGHEGSGAEFAADHHVFPDFRLSADDHHRFRPRLLLGASALYGCGRYCRRRSGTYFQQKAGQPEGRPAVLYPDCHNTDHLRL